MMRHLVSATCGLFLACTGAAVAQMQPVLVELYTSQGCSSCPPADEIFSKLAKDPGIVALSLHVDYWDYIGWKDTFASPQFTKRQKAYAKAAGSRMIYTPQVVVAGVLQVQGNDVMAVSESIRHALTQDSPVELSVARQADQVVIQAMTPAPFPRPTRVQVVRYRPEETVDIGRGENAGRQVTYHNIVTSWQPVAEWGGEAPLNMTVEAAGPEPVVVIIQAEGPAQVLAVAQIK